jgi:hypothetical protein
MIRIDLPAIVAARRQRSPRERRADATSVVPGAEKSFCDAGFRHFAAVRVVKSAPKF